MLHEVVPVLDIHTPLLDYQPGGLGGPAEGAGVDVGRAKAFALESPSTGPCLCAAPGREVERRRLALSLYDALGVRVGLAVPYQHEPHLPTP